MATHHRLSRKAEQGQATRDALVAAAREEFGTRGYRDTTIDGIVGRAKVTKGAFYHHFSGKKDVFFHVFENVKKELGRAAFVTHVDHEPFATPELQTRELRRFGEQSNVEVWEQLKERCRRYIELHTSMQIRRIVLMDARWVLPRDALQRIEGDYGVVLLRADLRRAMQRGLVRRLPLRTLAMILTGALNEACLLVAENSEAKHMLDETMLIIEQLLEGLREPQSASGSVPTKGEGEP